MEGCPICYLWFRNEQYYMEHLLTDEAVMDPEFRERALFSSISPASTHTQDKPRHVFLLKPLFVFATSGLT